MGIPKGIPGWGGGHIQPLPLAGDPDTPLPFPGVPRLNLPWGAVNQEDWRRPFELHARGVAHAVLPCKECSGDLDLLVIPQMLCFASVPLRMFVPCAMSPSHTLHHSSAAQSNVPSPPPWAERARSSTWADVVICRPNGELLEGGSRSD